MLNVVLLIGVSHIKFDYKDIKTKVEELLQGQDCKILADDFEDEIFEDNKEDLLIEVDAFKYDDEYSSNLYSVSLSLENLLTEKNLELQISQKGDFTTKTFFELLDKLIILAKFSIQKDIF